ncbi:hypothetical protein HMN09_00192600 [Mycena chlorophos]|uniref:F-box domain-containing protein n=1 Tax=Mycena chlorophos TaxID=658473 RepID=A0A8H6TNJ2_MYCCL|nr:hypothetical protein HMN09_00192600 [Mycena chlorophos]
MAPVLPLELVDLILSNFRILAPLASIDTVNPPDQAAAKVLGRCALVCRAWVPPSRRLLFHRLTITRTTAHAFACLFPSARSRKSVAVVTFLPFVREIVLDGPIAEDRWLHTVFLAKLIEHLPTSLISTLSLRGLSTPWDEYACGLPSRDVLVNVTHLELCGKWKLAETIGFIASFSLLEDLTVESTGTLDAFSPELDSLPPPSTLRRATFRQHRCRPIFNWMQQRRPSGLEALHFTLPDQRIAEPFIVDALEYIAAQGPSLKSLGLLVLGEDRLWNLPCSDSDYRQLFPSSVLSRWSLT